LNLEDSHFSPQLVLRILNMCVLVFCVVSVVGQPECVDLFMVFNFWIDSGFIFEPCS